jgi:hypothetical protein
MNSDQRFCACLYFTLLVFMLTLHLSESGLSEYGTKLNDLGISTIKDLAKCRDEVTAIRWSQIHFEQ